MGKDWGAEDLKAAGANRLQIGAHRLPDEQPCDTIPKAIEPKTKGACTQLLLYIYNSGCLNLEFL